MMVIYSKSYYAGFGDTIYDTYFIEDNKIFKKREISSYWHNRVETPVEMNLTEFKADMAKIKLDELTDFNKIIAEIDTAIIKAEKIC